MMPLSPKTPPTLRMWHTREKLGTSCFCFLRENRMSPAAFPFRKLSPLLWIFALPSTLPPRRNVNVISSLYRNCDLIYANKTDGSRKGEMRDSGCRSTRIHQRACRCVIPTFPFFLSARQQLNLPEKQHLTNKGFLCNIYFLKLLSFFHFFFNLTVTNRKKKSLSFCTSFILHLCLFIYLISLLVSIWCPILYREKNPYLLPVRLTSLCFLIFVYSTYQLYIQRDCGVFVVVFSFLFAFI